MNIKPLFFCLTLVLSVSTTIQAQDLSNAGRTMAQIIIELNHVPKDEQRAALEEVAGSSSLTAAEKVIVASMLNINHKVQFDDKKALLGVITSPGASPSERSLAGALYRFNHQPNDKDVAIISQLLK